MRRAINEFAATGMRVIPAPVHLPTQGEGSPWPEVLPNLSSFRSSSLAIYELIGQAAQWLMPPTDANSK